MTSLPPGWVEATIADLATYVQRGKSPKYADASDLPVVNQKCVRWWGIDEQHLKFVHPNQRNAWSAERFLRAGDLLWNSTGTGTIGRAALFQGSSRFEQMVVDSHVTIVRTTGYEPKLLHNWIASPAIQGQIHRMHNGSTNQVELSRGQVLGTKVPVPPLNEQRRIVDKIEALNAKSRRAKEALEAIPPLLEKFRQSILAAAFRGDLTADWRAKNPDVEPASKLLERIRTERRRRWEEAELEKLRAKGTPPRDDRWKAKYQEPAAVDTEGLPELPEGWVWAAAEELCEPGAEIVYGIVQPGPVVPDGVPYVRGMDIQDGAVLVEQLLRTHPDIAAKYDRASLQGGDVLLGIIRATRVAIVPDCLKGANITQGTARFRPSSAIRTHFLAGALEGPFSQSWLHAHYRGIDMPGLNLRDVRRLPLPLAPLAEQAEIAAAVGGAQSKLRELRARHSQCHSLIERLVMAILSKAFRGELVPQDPADEPASVLLERIRPERDGQVPASSQRTGRKRPTKRQAAE